MAELEVEGERENWVEKSDARRSAGGRAVRTLIHGDVAPGLEQHHRNGSSGNHISDNQFRDDTVRGDNCQISEPSNDTNISDTHLMPIRWFVTAWIMPMGTMYSNAMMRAKGENEAPHGELRRPHLDTHDPEHEHRDEDHRVPIRAPAGRGFMRCAWMTGCSLIERRTWIQICLLKHSSVCMSVAVIDAKESPNETAKVVLLKSGEHASYAVWLKVDSAVRVCETS